MDKVHTVLIIDDEINVIKSLEYLIEDEGYNIIIALSGKEGVQKYKDNDVDIVFLDLRMPDMNGITALQKIKKYDPFAEVIIISGASDHHHVVEALRNGAVDYFLKPVTDVELLLHAMKRSLKQRSLAGENRVYRENLEKLVEKRTAELAESEMRSSALLSVLPDILLVVDDKGNYKDAIINNPEEEDFSAGKIMEKNVYDVFAEDVANIHMRHISEALQTGEIQLFTFRYKKSVPRVFEVRIVVSSDNELIEIIRDISYEDHLEKELRSAQKMKAIGTLAGGVAHDFNNILFIIQGYAQILKSRLAGKEKLLPMLEHILEAVHRGSKLVKYLLTFSRQQEEGMRELQLQFLLKETLKMIESTIPSHVKLETDIDRNLPAIIADPAQMQQAIMNLITNACQAMKKEGVLSVKLRFPTAQEAGPDAENYLLLEIADTGKGISRDIQERIFEPYFTTRNIAENEGKGLGLAVVHGIVKQHNGRITVKSFEGEGSEFYILLPIADQGDEKKVSRNIEHVSTERHIMVVDDDERVANMLGEYLEEMGYKVETFVSSEQALLYLLQHLDTYDVVITDESMPGITGLELAKTVNKKKKGIPFIMCTGFNEKYSEKELQQAGIVLSVTKPVLFTSLAEEIEKLLSSR